MPTLTEYKKYIEIGECQFFRCLLYAFIQPEKTDSHMSMLKNGRQLA